MVTQVSYKQNNVFASGNPIKTTTHDIHAEIFHIGEKIKEKIIDYQVNILSGEIKRLKKWFWYCRKTYIMFK